MSLCEVNCHYLFIRWHFQENPSSMHNVHKLKKIKLNKRNVRRVYWTFFRDSIEYFFFVALIFHLLFHALLILKMLLYNLRLCVSKNIEFLAWYLIYLNNSQLTIILFGIRVAEKWLTLGSKNYKITFPLIWDENNFSIMSFAINPFLYFLNRTFLKKLKNFQSHLTEFQFLSRFSMRRLDSTKVQIW